MHAAGEVLGPALFAGLVAVGVTRAIERWGGVAGGLIGTLPSTIVPAALGLYAASPDEAAFREAMAATPVGMLLNACFLLLWRTLPPRLPAVGLGRRLGLMLAASLAAWASGAAALTAAFGALRARGVPALGLGGGAALALLVLGAWACRRRPPAPAGRGTVGPGVLVLRGALAALAIGLAVALMQRGGPLVAGMAAVFPAIFLTTMVALWWAQGEAVPAGAIGPMMLGSSSVAAFALLAAAALPACGPAAGTTLAWLGAALGVTLPSWTWLRRAGP